MNKIAEEVGFEMRDVRYTFYDPIGKEFFYTEMVKTNYLVHYTKI